MQPALLCISAAPPPSWAPERRSKAALRQQMQIQDRFGSQLLYLENREKVTSLWKHQKSTWYLLTAREWDRKWAGDFTSLSLSCTFGKWDQS